ncbi:hypothetical protein [Sediminicola luteus]
MFLVAVLGVLEALIKLGIALYVTNTSFDKLISYGSLMAVMAIILLLIRRVYCHLKYNEVTINVKKYFDRSLFKEMGSFAGWSFLGSSSSMIANYGQGIVLNMFFGPRVNAAQGIANQVSGQLSAFSTTMLSALNPGIAKSEGAGKRGSMLKMTAMGSKMSFFLLSFMCIPVLIEMPYILGLWLKDVPAYAVVFCRLLLIKNLIEQLSIPVSTSIKAVGNIRDFQIASSILTFFPLIISFGFFFLGYPPYFLYVVFIGYAILNSGLIFKYGNKYCGLALWSFIKNVVLRCVFSFLAVLLLSLIPQLVLDEDGIRLLIVTGSSGLFFIIIVYVIGFNKQEKNWLNMLLKSFAISLKEKLSIVKI